MKEFFKTLWLKIAPGIMTLKINDLMAQEFGLRNKLKCLLTLLLPAYFLQPKAYYIKKITIHKAIKYEYTMFKSTLEYEGDIHFLIFTNHDIYKYDTHGHREIYEKQFNTEGLAYGQGTTNNT